MKIPLENSGQSLLLNPVDSWALNCEGEEPVEDELPNAKLKVYGSPRKEGAEGRQSPMTDEIEKLHPPNSTKRPRDDPRRQIS